MYIHSLVEGDHFYCIDREGQSEGVVEYPVLCDEVPYPDDAGHQEHEDVTSSELNCEQLYK